MAQGTIWECTAIQLHGNTRFTNVWYLQQTSNDASLVDPRQSPAEAIATEFYSDLAPLLSNKWKLLCIEVRDSGTTGQDRFQYDFPLTGSKLTEPLPSHAVAIIAFNTTNGAKGRSCRTYISGATVDDEVDNNLTNDFGDGLSAVAAKMTDEITNIAANVTFLVGPQNPHGAEWEGFYVHDVRQPYTRLKSRRADVFC